MSIMFWGIATVMLAVAIGVVAVPLRAGDSFAWKPAVAILLLMPAIAFGLYSNIGTPQATSGSSDHKRTQPTARMSASVGNRAGQSTGSVSSLLEGLEDRLEREPDDAGSWLLLAKSYQHLDRPADAAVAYERAKALGKSDAALEKLLINAGQAIEPQADPAGPALRGRVSLSADADELVRPDDTVFIFAKESREHRMPIVALRRSAAELPLDFVLTDKDAMVAGTRLSDYDQLVVTAKISRSGMATDVTDGLESWSESISPLDHQKIELVITGQSPDRPPASAESNE